MTAAAIQRQVEAVQVIGQAVQETGGGDAL